LIPIFLVLKRGLDVKLERRKVFRLGLEGLPPDYSHRHRFRRKGDQIREEIEELGDR